ncbi:MAG TPA: helix-turn-helix transcriptional regulator [Verrucomicrobiae bacterium]|nr:helix-turn-helix transcriptional regulator [Verrucomicrobiae bacterium]
MHTLRELRETNGLTINELAELTGVAPCTITGIERRTSPYRTQQDVAWRLAQLFEVPVRRIFAPGEVSHLGRPAGTGKPIGSKETIIHHPDIIPGSLSIPLDVRLGRICQKHFITMPLNGSGCQDCN